MTNRATTIFITACRGVVGGVIEIPPDTDPGEKNAVLNTVIVHLPGTTNKTRGPTHKVYTLVDVIRFIFIVVTIIVIINHL